MILNININVTHLMLNILGQLKNRDEAIQPCIDLFYTC